MKRADIEAAAKRIVNHIPCCNGDECAECFRERAQVAFAIEWALEQVREWADREYDKRGDKMQDEFIVGERIALAECCEFCKVEGDK